MSTHGQDELFILGAMYSANDDPVQRNYGPFIYIGSYMDERDGITHMFKTDGTRADGGIKVMKSHCDAIGVNYKNVLRYVKGKYCGKGFTLLSVPYDPSQEVEDDCL